MDSLWALHGEGWPSQQQNHKKRKPRQLVTPKSQASPAAAALKQSFMAGPRGRVEGQELSCQLSAKAGMTHPQSPREQCWATVVNNMRYWNDALTKPLFVKSTCTNKNFKEWCIQVSFWDLPSPTRKLRLSKHCLETSSTASERPWVGVGRMYYLHLKLRPTGDWAHGLLLPLSASLACVSAGHLVSRSLGGGRGSGKTGPNPLGSLLSPPLTLPG